MIGYVSGWTEEKLEQIRHDPYFAKKLQLVRERAEKYLETDPPLIKFSDIHAFVTTGNRSVYEKVYGEYNSRVRIFAFLYMLDKDAFIPSFNLT